MSMEPLSFRPARGDVWLIDLGNMSVQEDGTKVYHRFREHAEKRPCVILSNDQFNWSAAELVVVVPMTSQEKAISTRVRIDPPEGGVRKASFAICEGIRSVARQFLIRKWGILTNETLQEIELQIRDLIDI
jgi:mRNA interferase MazF